MIKVTLACNRCLEAQGSLIEIKEKEPLIIIQRNKDDGKAEEELNNYPKVKSKRHGEGKSHKQKWGRWEKYHFWRKEDGYRVRVFKPVMMVTFLLSFFSKFPIWLSLAKLKAEEHCG